MIEAASPEDRSNFLIKPMLGRVKGSLFLEGNLTTAEQVQTGHCEDIPMKTLKMEVGNAGHGY